MASNFLDNLKNAVEKGEFNSEAANKINEIANLAESKMGNGSNASIEMKKVAFEKKYEGSVTDKPVTEELALELNADYEKLMAAIKKQVAVNVQLATLIDIFDMVKASVEDMLSFTNELEIKFEKEFEAKDSITTELLEKIEEVKLKYKSFIN